MFFEEEIEEWDKKHYRRKGKRRKPNEHQTWSERLFEEKRKTDGSDTREAFCRRRLRWILKNKMPKKQPKWFIDAYIAGFEACIPAYASTAGPHTVPDIPNLYDDPKNHAIASTAREVA